MPQVTLDVTAPNAQRIITALDNSSFVRLPAETDLAYFKRWVRSLCVSLVHSYERQVAMSTAATNTPPDNNIIS